MMRSQPREESANRTKSVLRLPDLEHAKAAVLNSLNSTDAKRGYRHAIDEFVDWYCPEPLPPDPEIAPASLPGSSPFTGRGAPPSSGYSANSRSGFRAVPICRKRHPEAL
jgi:hypothetical protein